MFKCCPFGSKKCQSGTSARVIDGKLILSFLEAENPVVWQMDLLDVKASALELQQDDKKDRYTLMLKTPQKDNADIAVFNAKDKAVEALGAVSQALEDGQGYIQPASVNMAGPLHRQKSSKKTWVIIVLIALFLFFLMGVWGNMSTKTARLGQAPGPSTSSSLKSAPNAAGVPLSADEFLRRR